MNTLYPVSLDRSDYEERDDLDRQQLIDDFKADAQAAYDRRRRQLGAEVMRELERRVLLTVLDRKWREHLYEMDYLREGIGLRAMAQRDPLVEYQREGGDMFNAMMEAFMEEVVGFVFHLEVEVDRGSAGRGGHRRRRRAGADRAPQSQRQTGGAATPLIESGPDPDGPGVAVHVLDEDVERGRARGRPSPSSRRGRGAGRSRPQIKAKGLAGRGRRRSSYSAPDEDGSVKTAGKPASKADDPYAGVGRNAPCPCGSGKKFKMCHGRAGAV